VSSQSMSGGASKRSLAIVLAIIAIVALIVGILWFAGAAPSFLNSGSHVKSGSHLYRGAVAIVIAVVLGAGAWFSTRKK
jgi:hypothetical protein